MGSEFGSPFLKTGPPSLAILQAKVRILLALSTSLLPMLSCLGVIALTISSHEVVANIRGRSATTSGHCRDTAIHDDFLRRTTPKFLNQGLHRENYAQSPGYTTPYISAALLWQLDELDMPPDETSIRMNLHESPMAVAVGSALSQRPKTSGPTTLGSAPPDTAGSDSRSDGRVRGSNEPGLRVLCSTGSGKHGSIGVATGGLSSDSPTRVTQCGAAHRYPKAWRSKLQRLPDTSHSPTVCNVGSPRGPLNCNHMQQCRSWQPTRRLILEIVNPSQIHVT